MRTMMFTLFLIKVVHPFASKHKPQTFLDVYFTFLNMTFSCAVQLVLTNHTSYGVNFTTPSQKWDWLKPTDYHIYKHHVLKVKQCIKRFVIRCIFYSFLLFLFLSFFVCFYFFQIQPQIFSFYSMQHNHITKKFQRKLRLKFDVIVV